MKYKFLSHTADVKFQAFGNTLEKCFGNAAFALVNIICKEKVKTIIKKDIKVEGEDLERLLYNFLEEFLFLIDSKNFIFGKFKKIKIYQKNDAPPHLKKRGLNGARFLDARESSHSKECGFQDSRHKKNKNYILTAEILGDNLKNYQTQTGVKAITYNEMWVTSPSKNKGKKFVCQVVVDV